MNADYILLFFLTGILMVAGGMIMAYMISPKSENKQKRETYESGIPTIGKTWVQFKVGYYLFAILFLIFDVETVFIFPWAVAMKKVGMTAFVEILIFFVILGIGLLYAWKKNALEWE